MKKETIIEVATYLGVFFAINILTPIIGKLSDYYFLNYKYIFAASLSVLISGIIIFSIGLVLVLWTIVLFKIKGKGTPNPLLPPKKFIVTGPYKYVRNPMALGGSLCMFGESLVYYSPSVLVLSIIYTIVVYFNAKYVEEPKLKERFAKAYEDYLKMVPRFLPKFFK